MPLGQTQKKPGHLAETVGPVPKGGRDADHMVGQKRKGYPTQTTPEVGRRGSGPIGKESARGYSEKSFDNLPSTNDATVSPDGRKRVRKISGE